MFRYSTEIKEQHIFLFLMIIISSLIKKEQKYISSWWQIKQKDNIALSFFFGVKIKNDNFLSFQIHI